MDRALEGVVFKVSKITYLDGKGIPMFASDVCCLLLPRLLRVPVPRFRYFQRHFFELMAELPIMQIPEADHYPIQHTVTVEEWRHFDVDRHGFSTGFEVSQQKVPVLLETVDVELLRSEPVAAMVLEISPDVA